MPVRMRLQRHGKKRAAFYHIVTADARAPRDGKFIEKLGTYNPNTNPAQIDIDRDKALEWLGKGAQPTHTVRSILRYTGVLYKKHLQRGVTKGALTQEAADVKLTDWLAAKAEKISAVSKGVADKEAGEIKAQLDAEYKKRMKAAADALPPVEEAAEEVVAEATEAVADAADVVADAAEEVKEVVAEATETPAADAADTPAE